MTGRVCACGPGPGGEDGVRHVLRSLLHDLELTMRLAGFASLADLGPEALARRPSPANSRGQPGIGRSSGPETGNPGA
jgi:isopentenyl diphosphate isomerase/L-lactate dehydrogenase-like FMN-dependent dehydrogenase